MAASTTAPSEAQHTNAHIDPAAQVADAGFVPVQTRSERPHSFDPDDFGAPTGREVNWKHTPVAKLGGLFADEPGDDDAVTYDLDAVEAFLEPSEEGPYGEFFRPEDLPSALAWKRGPRGLHIQLPAEAELDEPITVPIKGTSADKRAFGQILIEAQPHSRGTIVLDHSGSAQYAQNVEIIVRDGASLTVISLQRWDDDAVHASAHQATVGADATLKHFVISFGGGVVRVNPSVELTGAGSEGYLYGLSYADGGQHLESQVYLHHKGAHTKGDVLYKGALQGEGAHSVWIGDVLIGADATGTDSYEANRNLVLTEGARADSIPNLEIETGDILGAGHASATGRFDDEQLFYLQARGITEEEARRLVVLGFLTDIVQRLGIPALETELLAAIEAELAEVSA
ncbi:FeS cluster assembly protein SufD [Microbacterium oxydans]|uniref:FeS cluster assembly protein SufD n=1 Tax=Microbacterium oxydans TaxID=82380 RepID=A0A0F0KFQ4_9MICO|nr:Fe-S cluster assembly protein SufD [Microbacterium oxydans]KJL19712.1 FeS cluster assembly protein SufD [Microbacterium oxydans]